MDPHTCAVCLLSYRQPKFLPCFHSFCASCIQSVADTCTQDEFPCPLCRQKTSLPPDGVNSFQTNSYILTADTREKKCKFHSDKTLEFYCVQCDEVLCINGKLTEHEGHKTEDLKKVASHKILELQENQQRVQRALDEVTENMTSLQAEREALAKKCAAVEKNIHNRHAVIVAAAERRRDEALRSLQSVREDLDRDLLHDIEKEEYCKVVLSMLLQQLANVITSDDYSHVLTVAKDITSGRGSPAAINAMTSRPDRLLYRPVLQFDINTDVMVQTIDDYLGSVGKMELEVTEPEVKVTECFQCAQDPDVEVFSMSHVERDPPQINISYERLGMKRDAPAQAFSETGTILRTIESKGKSTHRPYEEDGCFMIDCEDSGGIFSTYSKSPGKHFKLINELFTWGTIRTVVVSCFEPFDTEAEDEFTIKVGPHRAFDADTDTEKYFAVVEENMESSSRRSVRLYQRSVERAVSTYTPPTPEYQPSDVCFYTLGGQRVLLITDERNDAIHVVTIQEDGTLQFERYLSAGCPSLIQPTAIYVDGRDPGRLWVACRGGAILVIEQIE